MLVSAQGGGPLGGFPCTSMWGVSVHCAVIQLHLCSLRANVKLNPDVSVNK